MTRRSSFHAAALVAAALATAVGLPEASAASARVAFINVATDSSAGEKMIGSLRTKVAGAGYDLVTDPVLQSVLESSFPEAAITPDSPLETEGPDSATGSPPERVGAIRGWLLGHPLSETRRRNAAPVLAEITGADKVVFVRERSGTIYEAIVFDAGRGKLDVWVPVASPESLLRRLAASGAKFPAKTDALSAAAATGGAAATRVKPWYRRSPARPALIIGVAVLAAAGGAVVIGLSLY